MPSDNLHKPPMSTADGEPVAAHSRQSQRKMSWKKKAALSVVVVVSFLGLLEVVLVIAGVEPRSIDIYAGFSSSVSVFAERKASGKEPMMVTADNKLMTFNSQEFAKNKPAGTYRIFCLGGSTTHGYPYDDRVSFSSWLRELLAQSDSSRKWEVVNAGAISYATHRISLVADELAAYEPDLFIIYAGHNEFLERTTYASMLQTPPVLHGLGGWLSGTRTYSLISSLMRPPPKKKNKSSPTQDEDQDFRDNEVGLEVFHRDARMYQDTLADYRSHLKRMAETGRQSGAQVIFVIPASNLRDWSPWKSEHKQNLTPAERRRCDIIFSHADNAYFENRFVEALSAVQRALAIDDRFAGLHYLRGQALDRLDRHEDAKQAYVRARNEDICPLRAPDDLQRVMSDVAAELKVPLLDFPTIVEQHSDHQIPGKTLFHDHVHLNIQGHQILARSLLDLMIAEKIVKPSSPIDEKQLKGISDRIDSRRSPFSDGMALSNLANVLKRTGKIEESARLAIQAVGLAPDDDNVQFMAGCGYRDQGRLDEAKVCFEAAIRINSQYSEAHNNLGILFAQGNDLDQAEDHFRRALEIYEDFAGAHNNLGMVYFQRGMLEKARVSFEKAVSLNKNFVEAIRNLEQVKASLDKRK